MTIISPDWENNTSTLTTQKFLQLHGKFIVSSIKSGILIIDQKRAHERILYEKYLKLLANKKSSSQTLLYPENIRLKENDAEILKDIDVEIKTMGFDINEAGKCTFIINAIPSDLPENENLQHIIESIIDNFKQNSVEVKINNNVNLSRSMAKSLCIKHGKTLTEAEMNTITDNLFACEMPYQTPSGKPIINVVSIEEILGKFK